MPEINFRYVHGLILSPAELTIASNRLKELVSKMASTEGRRLGWKDVDFIPTQLSPGAAVSWKIGINIDAIGYSDRKEKITPAAVEKLKEKTAFLFSSFPDLQLKDISIWVRYFDTDGPHA